MKLEALEACELTGAGCFYSGCALPLTDLHPWKSAFTSCDSLLLDNSAPIGSTGGVERFACAVRRVTNHERNMYGASLSCQMDTGRYLSMAGNA